MWRKGNPSTLLVGMQVSAATMEHPKNKFKMELSYDQAITLLGIHLKKPKTPI